MDHAPLEKARHKYLVGRSFGARANLQRNAHGFLLEGEASKNPKHREKKEKE